MALSTAVRDNEASKFRDAGNGKSKVAVVTEGDVNGLLSGASYDEIQATYPTTTTELYTYYLDSSSVAVVEITYTDSTKKVFLRARRL